MVLRRSLLYLSIGDGVAWMARTSKFGKLHGAFAYLNKMRRNGLKPNVVTYSTFIDAFCKEHIMQEASKWELQSRKPSGSTDFTQWLALLIETNLKQSEEHKKSKKSGMISEDVFEVCKPFYFVGQETTSERAREEVMQVFDERAPEFDGLSPLKIVCDFLLCLTSL
ncbi:hypothetical protein M5K25_008260 [Dendrobium thyrsiflorum]|uniref:Pentatricopeptide repeat-containing protein n=1 Tax=Dendrobium thyrsiflorum TaxID=117978 RepID=A0ABD0VFE6_DENTH